MSELRAIILTKPRPHPDAWLQWVIPGELPDYERADGQEVVLRQVEPWTIALAIGLEGGKVYEMVEGDDE